MNGTKKTGLGARLGAARRAAADGDGVERTKPAGEGFGPAVLTARGPVAAPDWIAARRAEFDELLHAHGAVLLRDFAVPDAAAFATVVARFGDALEYRERSSPRTPVGANVYTSTEYPADQEIFFHNENSYAARYPRRLFFYCATPPETGGATPLADVRAMLGRLPSELVEKFERKGVLYLRNFGGEVGMSWREVFQTTRRAEVERICAAGGYAAEWLGGDRLRTRRVGPAVVRHPRDGARVWFNHAAFFHVSTHPPALGDALLARFAPDELPHNTFYGDGEPFEPETLDLVRAAYRAASGSFAWRSNDVLIVDNLLTAHARASFRGPRRILVAMTD